MVIVSGKPEKAIFFVHSWLYIKTLYFYRQNSCIIMIRKKAVIQALNKRGKLRNEQ